MMKRPAEALFILGHLEKHLDELENLPDVIAVAYLKEIYDLLATYGLDEIVAKHKAAFDRVFERFDMTNSVKFCVLVRAMHRLPATYSRNKLPEMYRAAEALDVLAGARGILDLIARNLALHDEQYPSEG